MLCDVNESSFGDFWCNTKCHVTLSLIATQRLQDYSCESTMNNVDHTESNVY
jgi:hypothetical protein